MQKLLVVVIPLLFIVTLVLSGCTTGQSSPSPITEENPSVNPSVEPGAVTGVSTGVADEDSNTNNDSTNENDTNTVSDNTTTLIKSDKQFMILAKLIENEDNLDKNIMISPLSINMALQMAMNGMSDACRSEYEAFYGKTLAELNEENKKLIERYADNSVLSIANSIWVREDLIDELNKDVDEAVKKNFDSEIYTLDLSDVSGVNKWVSDKTHEMITKILDKLDPDTVSVLLNAIYFKGNWKEQFEDYQVSTDKFTLEDGTQVETDFMSETSDGLYLETDNARGFVKGYTNGCKFIAILPDVSTFNLQEFNLQEFIDSADKLSKVNYDLDIKIPKFESSFETKLNGLMDAMGLGGIFTDGSMSNLIDNHPDIAVSDAIHKTAIRMNESGTEASAVTALTFKENCIMIEEEPEVIKVYLDRPFYYAIVDSDNTVLFMGYMRNPTIK